MTSRQILKTSDQNYSHDSATVILIEMAVVTTSIILMSQNVNDRFENHDIILCENFLFHTWNVFWPMTILKKLSFFQFGRNLTVILTEFLVKWTEYAYIRIQRVKASENQHFVFSSTSLQVLTVF